MKNALWRELGRRHVLRLGVAYVSVGLLLAAVIIWIFPLLDIPAWSGRLIAILLIAGFPLAMVLAWRYEITPEGIRQTEPLQSPAARSAEEHYRIRRFLNGFTIAVLGLAVAVLLVRELTLSRQIASPVENGAPRSAIEDRSIAVLPFQSLSSDPANAFFAGGIQDEIMTRLARVGDLRLIARSSTAQYADQPVDIREVARRLGVAYLLAGSVQKAGERVRVSVQLIEGRSQDQVWARTWDRDLKDVFAVESEIALRIVDSLHASLSGEEQAAIEREPTANLQAHAEWLKARALSDQSSFDRDNIETLLAIYRRVVALDPEFGLAWAELVKLNVYSYWEGYDEDGQALARARQALERASILAPDLPQTAMARGWYLYYGERQFEQALNAFRSAQRSMPSNDQAWIGAALVERRMGQWQESIEDGRQARILSPNNIEALAVLAETLMATRNCRQAQSAIDAGLALKPDDPFLQDMLAICLWNTEPDLGQVAQRLAEQPETMIILAARARTALFERSYDQASNLYRRTLAMLDDEQQPDNYKDYISIRVVFQQGLALSEQRAGRLEVANAIYEQIKSDAEAKLAAGIDNLNIEAAQNIVIGLAAAGLGEAALARRHGERAVELIPPSADALDGFAWQRYLARILGLSGDAERAVPLIRHLLSITTTDPVTVPLLTIDPVWDPIRSDPGFQALLR